MKFGKLAIRACVFPSRDSQSQVWIVGIKERKTRFLANTREVPEVAVDIY